MPAHKIAYKSKWEQLFQLHVYAQKFFCFKKWKEI